MIRKVQRAHFSINTKKANCVNENSAGIFGNHWRERKRYQKQDSFLLIANSIYLPVARISTSMISLFFIQQEKNECKNQLASLTKKAS